MFYQGAAEGLTVRVSHRTLIFIWEHVTGTLHGVKQTRDVEIKMHVVFTDS